MTTCSSVFDSAPASRSRVALIGWYGGRWDDSHTTVRDPDIFNAFGQYISGMARMYKATDDTVILEKASYLIDEWAKAMDADGYFFLLAQTAISSLHL